jgi:hypothetical protein
MAETTTEPYFERLAMEEDHPDGRIGHVCNTCDRPVDLGPCPNHAPREVPGLVLAECGAEPRHWVWTLAGDYYEPPCPRCQLAEYDERERLARQCKHWGWRSWMATRWLTSKAYTLGVIAGSGSAWGDGHDWCVDSVRWRGGRVYVLGVPVNTWRCWLKGRHRRGEHVGFGFCGKCVPWSCCGSIVTEHAAGCPEDPDTAESVTA